MTSILIFFRQHVLANFTTNYYLAVYLCNYVSWLW